MWRRCLDDLDRADWIDPAGASSPALQGARAEATKHVREVEDQRRKEREKPPQDDKKPSFGKP
jgi:hypothetical protein